MEKKLAILGYHKVGDPPDGWYTWNYVPAKVFEEHLQYLKDEHWAIINEEQFLSGLEQPETLPPKSALITFDDGYKSNLEIALPILKKFNYPAIVFVPTAFVGGYNAFDADIFYEPKEDICTWEELQDLERNNISVQSHGVYHTHFSDISDMKLSIEISQSKRLLDTKLGKSISIFSFPYGDNGGDENSTKKMLLNAGYKAAVLYEGSLVDISSADPFRLPRVPVGADTILPEMLKTL